MRENILKRIFGTHSLYTKNTCVAKSMHKNARTLSRRACARTHSHATLTRLHTPYPQNLSEVVFGPSDAHTHEDRSHDTSTPDASKHPTTIPESALSIFEPQTPTRTSNQEERPLHEYDAEADYARNRNSQDGLPRDRDLMHEDDAAG